MGQELSWREPGHRRARHELRRHDRARRADRRGARAGAARHRRRRRLPPAAAPPHPGVRFLGLRAVLRLAWHRLPRGCARDRPAAGLSGRSGLRLELGRGPEAARNAGFAAVYTLALLMSATPIACGLDPLKLPVFSMALPAASLPLT